MKITTSTDNWNTTNTAKTITVDDEGMAKMVGLISKNIYSKPASAFREYWLNARESHQATGTDTPMTVILPGNDTTPSDDVFTVGNATISVNTSADHMFIIRDFGTGMNRAELKNMITSAGSSSKDNSDEFGGGMGIGSLSGFSVSDQIVFTAFKDGKRNTVILSAENSSWAMADEVDTDEDNGVEVSFVVHPDKVADFTRGAIGYLNVNGYTDKMNLIIPDNEFANVNNVNAHCNVETIPMKWATLRSVRGENSQIDGNVLGKIKANLNNLTVRIDGCAYEGIIPEGVSFDPARSAAQWINDNVNRKALDALSGNGNMFCASGSGFFAGNGALAHSVIVDVAVGKYSNEIQPSRETIALPKSDVQEISDAIAATVYNNAHEGMNIVSQYIDCVANGSTVDMSTVIDWANQIQAMDNDTRAALMQIGSLFSHVFTTVGSNNVGVTTLSGIAQGINIILNTNSKVFSSDIDETVGFVVADDILWKITRLRVSQTGKENIARLSIIGEFDPSKINVVPTTAKKYNNDTLTQYITTSNDNDEVTLFNTPVVAKLLDDDFFGAVFSDIRDVEGVSTIEFKEWKKLNNYNAKESAPKDNVTYDCVYGGRTRFNVDCATIAQYASNDGVEKVVVTHMYANRKAIGNFVEVFCGGDRSKIVQVQLDGRKKPEQAMKRLIAAGVDKDMIINADELNNGNIVKVALDSVSDSEKELIANIHLARNIAFNVTDGVDNKHFGMIADAMGFGSQYATVRHLFNNRHLDNAKAHNTLTSFGMHIVNALNDMYTKKERCVIESQLSESLHDDVNKVFQIVNALDIWFSVETFGIDKTVDIIKTMA